MPRTSKRFLCIRQHVNQCMFEVGEIVEAKVAPGKHWQEIQGNENPIAALRKKLEAEGVVWGTEWGLVRLGEELEGVAKFKAYKKQKEAFLKQFEKEK